MLLNVAYFVFSWVMGFTAYSNSIFIETNISQKSVGIIYAISAIGTLLISTFVISPLLQKVGNVRLAQYSTFAMLLSLIGIIASSNVYLLAISFILFFTTQVLLALSIDIFYKHITTTGHNGESRGKMVSLQHLGRIMGPMLAAYTTIHFGMRMPYIVSIIGIFIMTVTLIYATNNFKDADYKHTKLTDIITRIKNQRKTKMALFFAFLLYLFYALMVTYTPIFLLETLQVKEDSLGLLFTIMLLPFVIFGYPIGKKLDSGISARRTARLGLILMTLTTIVLGNIQSGEILIIGTILLISRVGAVLLETAADTLFFKSIQEEDSDLMGIMRDMQPIAYFVGGILGTSILILGEIRYIFYAIGFILSIGYIITYKKKQHATK
jgi:MFS family permease